MASWFRSWHGAPTDTKWLLIARRANVAPGMVSAVAWAVMDYASQAEDRGSIVSFDVETYAVFSGWDEDDIKRVIEAMRDKGIISQDDRLTAWEKRQPKREDDSTERVRAHRQRSSDDVTQCNAMKRSVTHGNNTDTDTDTDTECVNSERVNGLTRAREGNEAHADPPSPAEASPAETASATLPPPGAPVARASVTRTTGVRPNKRASEQVNKVAQIIGFFPPRAIHHQIDAAVDARDDDEFMQECYAEWLLRGFKKENYAWLTEWFVSGTIPEKVKAKSNGVNKLNTLQVLKAQESRQAWDPTEEELAAARAEFYASPTGAELDAARRREAVSGMQG